MKSVLISIQPKWCELIACGRKTIECRKSMPKIGEAFKCYIYCTKGKYESSELRFDLNYNISCRKIENRQGKIIGEFTCESFDLYSVDCKANTRTEIYASHPVLIPEFEYRYNITEEQLNKTCLTYEQLFDYGSNGGMTYGKLYGWYISDLKIYDKPKELSEFVYICPNDEDREYYHDELYPSCGNGGCKYNFRNIDTGFWECRRIITRPPQSWCFCEEIK